jgi:hypothetical protein
MAEATGAIPTVEVADAGNVEGSADEACCDVVTTDDGGATVIDANAAACLPTGPEECDGKDNDCNGVVDDGVCPCATETFGKSTYMFCKGNQTWIGAQGLCSVYGYRLVTIDTAAEDGWLATIAWHYVANRWWIGFSDQAQEGNWTWINSAATAYLHWADAEPSNGADEDCALIDRWGPAKGWDDAPCKEGHPFVCEAPSATLP